MTVDSETTRIVRSWLRTDEHESADRVLGNVLALLDATPQLRRLQPGRRASNVSSSIMGLAAAALLVVAVAGVGLLASQGGGVGTSVASPRVGASASASPQPSASAQVAPLPGDPATVIAQYAAIHVGWVYVYADGRVVFLTDLNAARSDGAIKYSYNERRLTQAGVDLVVSGALPASAFLSDPRRIPAQAWADDKARPYEPSTYALCYWLAASGELDENAEVDASEILDRLPAPAQALLRGKERAIVSPGPSDVVGWLIPPSPPAEPEIRECSEVTSDEARAVADILVDAGWRKDTADWMADPGATWSPIGWVDESLGMFIEQHVLLPHGIIRTWGG